MQQRGFTLIELLIVVAIIGIIAAIAVVALSNAVNRSRQTSTMSEIRTVATAIAAYKIDVNRYPAGSTVGDLEPVLVPVFTKILPDRDGWGNPLAYSTDSQGDAYTIRSFGRDGLPDADFSRGPVHNFNDDITHADGQFVQWPEGAQQ